MSSGLPALPARRAAAGPAAASAGGVRLPPLVPGQTPAQQLFTPRFVLGRAPPEQPIRYKWPSPPSREAKGLLVAERAERVWSRGWTHEDYKGMMDEVRHELLRSNAPSWRGHAYEKQVFKQVERRADLGAWTEPMSFPGAALLKWEALSADLDDMFLLSPGDTLRAGIDNCGIGVSLSTERGYADYALETASVTKVAPHPIGSRIVYPGSALGTETKARIKDLFSSIHLWSVAARLRCRVVVAVDYHALGLLLADDKEDVDDAAAAALVSECPLSGLSIRGTAPNDERLIRLPRRVEALCRVLGPTLGQVYDGHPDLLAHALSPGFWHTCATTATHAARASGHWPNLLRCLESVPNAIMNGLVSITGVEYMQSGSLPADLQRWCDHSGLSLLFNATTSDGIFEATQRVHRAMWGSAAGRREWTEGCFALSGIASSARVLAGGDPTPWKEKVVERAHQPIKRQAPFSRHSLRWALGRARFEERRRAGLA